MKQKTKGFFMLLMTAFIWGTAFVAQRKGMDFIGPFTFNGIRSFLGAGVLIPVILIILLALFFVAAVAYIFSKLKPHLPKALFYPMFLYLLINGTMNCFAIFRCVSMPTAAAITTAIGAALFFISDSSLFFVRFKKDSRLQTHFLVMLTYSIGEFLIVLGLL